MKILLIDKSGNSLVHSWSGVFLPVFRVPLPMSTKAM